jgi:hypothetical protein
VSVSCIGATSRARKSEGLEWGFPRHGRRCGRRWHWTVNLGPRSRNRRGHERRGQDALLWARKAGLGRHGDSEEGMAGCESSHPVRHVRTAAWPGGSMAWWCRGLGQGGWLLLFSPSLVALLASTPQPPHCRSLFVLHKPQQRFVRVT